MIKRIFFLLFLLAATGVTAQNFSSKAYKTGIYIYCGNELPRHFSYIIERKKDNTNEWNPVAELHAPKNEAECEATLLRLPGSLASLTNIDESLTKKIWQFAQKAITLDSLYSYAFDPRYQSVAGCAWFDDGITKQGEYQYRIYKLPKSGERTLLNEIKITFPGSPFGGTLKATSFKLNETNINISFRLSDSVNTAGIKLFRSLFKQNKFSEIPAKVIFTKEKGKIVAFVTDASVATGVTYSYLATPYDALGNMGTPTKDTLNIYNLSKPSEIGIVEKFDAEPNVEKRGVDLTWKLKNSLYVTSVDIYRSATYDGSYVKIASVSPKETTYFDDNKIKPATAYYYYILINTGYGNSLPSARVPVILKGNKQNLLPPQNLTISRNGRIVTLKFQRLGKEIHGYYVYRANGYIADLVQLPRMLLSKDSLLTYNDTLPLSANPEVYSYAVASVNTSYNISPLTERVSVQFSGGMLPVPSKVNAMILNKSVFITWDNVSEQNAAVSAYYIFRSTVDADNKETNLKRIAVNTFEQNNYTDSNIVEGAHYRYSIQCIGIDSSDVGSISSATGIEIPEQLPIQPGSVSAYGTDKKIVIHWDIPNDNNIAGYRIYRAVANKQATLLKEFTADVNQYEDTSVNANEEYFYYLKSFNKAGKESKPTDEVNAKAK
ncbi:MAG TPA: hypothetical protein PKK00_13135 [Bacteroidales bacterium]|nr:hypothetical protein [Bacteroidales bacterium]HPS17717.1 hypothetical protein [Bacteroidales bacterium]